MNFQKIDFVLSTNNVKELIKDENQKIICSKKPSFDKKIIMLN